MMLELSLRTIAAIVFVYGTHVALLHKTFWQVRYAIFASSCPYSMLFFTRASSGGECAPACAYGEIVFTATTPRFHAVGPAYKKNAQGVWEEIIPPFD